MTKIEFEEHRNYFITNYYLSFRLYDLDFYTYMMMQGLTDNEFMELNKTEDPHNVKDNNLNFE
jgi:hypothetical protein